MMENSEYEDYYIAAGLKDDCLKLIESFEETPDESFDDFCEIWKKMKFSYVYWNRTSISEMISFCEEALDIAKDFLSPSWNKTQRIGGIFLIYSLYFKSPMEKPKIRMTMKEWDNLIKLRNEIFKEKRFEAVYILNKLMEENAFSFCIHEQERGLEDYYVLKDFMKGNTETESSRNRDTQVTSIFTELSDISKSYINIKKELGENSSVSVPKLYNGSEIEELLSVINNIDNPESKKKSKKKNVPSNFTMESSSLTQTDDDSDFDSDSP